MSHQTWVLDDNNKESIYLFYSVYNIVLMEVNPTRTEPLQTLKHLKQFWITKNSKIYTNGVQIEN